ncbi:MAG TPA: hypothetical protein VM869_20960, partial [Enhygromyxa sp.]|nr:hypothetical protein [Enhygromyxa sp.]
DAAEEASVYEIRNGSIWGWVAVSDVWVTGKRSDGLWVQEVDGGPNSAIWVYVGENSPNLADIEIGDVVDVLGVSGKFNEVYEINALNGGVAIIGELDLLPGPNVLALADIDATWESVFVRVEGELTVVDMPGGGELVVDDGTATGTIDDYVFNVVDGDVEFADLGLGATFTAIQGPLNLSNATFKIAPRSAADLEGYLPAP